MRRRTRSREQLPATPLIVLVLLWLVPLIIAAFALTFAQARETRSLQSDAPPVTQVGEREADASTPVTVTLQRESQTALVSRDSGLVTAVFISRGDQFASGQHVLAIEDRIVRAQVALAPIVGDVLPNAAGPDVRRVADLLIGAQLLSPEAAGENYTDTMRTAIDDWNAVTGYPRDGVFRAASTVFVSEQSTAVHSVSVAPGVRLAEGDQLALALGAIAAASLQPADAGASLPRTAGPFELVAGSQVLAIQSATLTGDEAADLETFISEALAEQALQDFEGTGTSFSGAHVRLAEAERVATVPNQSVWVSANGNQCIFGVATSDASPQSASPIQVPDAAPLDGAVGVTAVGVEHVGTWIVTDAALLSSEQRSACGQ